MNLDRLDPFLVAVMLLNFFLLATDRLRSIIFAAALQGAILAVAYPYAHQDVHSGGESVVGLRLLALAGAMPELSFREPSRPPPARSFSFATAASPCATLTSPALLARATLSLITAATVDQRSSGTGVAAPFSFVLRRPQPRQARNNDDLESER